MAQLNVHVQGAPSPQRVDCCTAEAADWAKLGIVFPSWRMTDASGMVNFINTSGPLPGGKIAVVMACQKGISSVVEFDGTADVTVELPFVPFKQPFTPAPRVWRGNMCGIYDVTLPPVPGGASNPALVLSWFYDRYDAPHRAAIRAGWASRDMTHVLLSWPDSRSQGATPQSFLTTCQELLADGFFPCVMLCSKDYDPADASAILTGLAAVLPLLIGVVPLFCVGWELSLWLTPTQVQTLIDALTPQWLAVPGTRGYVHFQAGYFAFQQPGQPTAAFWQTNVGKLHGILHQRNFDDSPDFPSYQARIADCLNRFAGQDFCPSDSGFGVPFEFVALEITAQAAFNSGMSEADQNAWGQAALTTPPVTGPLGPVAVLGSGNGQ